MVPPSLTYYTSGEPVVQWVSRYVAICACSLLLPFSETSPRPAYLLPELRFETGKPNMPDDAAAVRRLIPTHMGRAIWGRERGRGRPG